MINGAVGGMRTLLWSCVLISIPLYAVALVLRQTLGRYAADEEFGASSFTTTAQAFFTMFRCVVGGDCSTQSGQPIFVLVTAEYGWEYGVVYCVTVMLMTFG